MSKSVEAYDRPSRASRALLEEANQLILMHIKYCNEQARRLAHCPDEQQLYIEEAQQLERERKEMMLSLM